MSIRVFTPEDYPELATWFHARQWQRAPQLNHLPRTGWVAEKNGEKLAAAWLYITNSDMALLEWSVTNPFLDPVLCLRALADIVSHIKQQAALLQPPVDAIIQFIPNEKLVRFYEKRLGFKFTEKASLMVWNREEEWQQ